MKTIYLLRHGKSDWDATFEADPGRPLAARGRSAAGVTGRVLSRLGEVPDRVVASPAVRARDTAALAAEAGGWATPVEEDAALYDTVPSKVLAWLAAGADCQRLLLAGHEPCWSGLVELLTGGRVEMPTAALARIDFEIDRWQNLAAGTGTLRWLLTPKLLSRLGIDA
jgi:phosphohistidine phosphatase